jgi:hypothetical protein
MLQQLLNIVSGDDTDGNVAGGNHFECVGVKDVDEATMKKSYERG